ncbi:pheromone A receptor-domain-containing protein [Mycena vulgaris]|nr:pheromone A receptor-domain-containing protein [Mycena vulgaris]
MRGIISVIWNGNVNLVAPVWCDISTKLRIGSEVALPVCTLALAFQVYRITLQQRRLGLGLKLGMCLGLPVIIMALHSIVQGHRFDVYEDFGCNPAVYLSIPSVIILDITPLIAAALALQVALLPVDVLDIPARNSASVYRNRLLPWTTWDDVHSYFLLVSQYPTALIASDVLQWLYFNNWMSVPISSLFAFAFFAFGPEAMRDYRACARWFETTVLRRKTGFQSTLSSGQSPRKFSLHNWVSMGSPPTQSYPQPKQTVGVAACQHLPAPLSPRLYDSFSLSMEQAQRPCPYQMTLPCDPHDHQIEGISTASMAVIYSPVAITPTGSRKTGFHTMYMLVVLAFRKDPSVCPTAKFLADLCFIFICLVIPLQLRIWVSDYLRLFAGLTDGCPRLNFRWFLSGVGPFNPRKNLSGHGILEIVAGGLDRPSFYAQLQSPTLLPQLRELSVFEGGSSYRFDLQAVINMLRARRDPDPACVQLCLFDLALDISDNDSDDDTSKPSGAAAVQLQHLVEDDLRFRVYTQTKSWPSRPARDGERGFPLISDEIPVSDYNEPIWAASG